MQIHNLSLAHYSETTHNSSTKPILLNHLLSGQVPDQVRNANSMTIRQKRRHTHIRLPQPLQAPDPKSGIDTGHVVHVLAHLHTAAHMPDGAGEELEEGLDIGVRVARRHVSRAEISSFRLVWDMMTIECGMASIMFRRSKGYVQRYGGEVNRLGNQNLG